VIIIGIADHEITACIAQGVDGIVTTDGRLEDLMDAIHRVTGDGVGRRAIDADRSYERRSEGANRLDAPRLTVREWQIAELLDRGMTNKDIARELHIEVATVKNHVHSVLRKLGVARRLEVPRRIRDMHAQGAEGFIERSTQVMLGGAVTGTMV
jgi:DNA-binding NarL/FixJ family response regulator